LATKKPRCFWWTSTRCSAWRYVLLVGALPALVVLLVRRTVRESPLWQRSDARRRAATARARGGLPPLENDLALTTFTLRRLFAEPVSRARMLKLLVLSSASLVGW
jgi:hypothetical protein